MGFELESLDLQIHGREKTHLQDSQQQELVAMERSLKDLPPPPSSSSSDQEIYAEDCSRLSSDQDATDQVDSFLKDALNSRNMITG